MPEKDNKFSPLVLDADRQARNGFAEVIYCEGKTVEHLIHTIEKMQESGENILGTRLNPQTAAEILKKFPKMCYDSISRTIKSIQKPFQPLRGHVAVLAAGTSDVPVAEEAYQTALFYGVEGKRYYDVGVAGLHRLLQKIDEIKKCDVAIVVAGMEGALPSVVGGLISQPIIACPTSVGYGVHLQGLTPLAAMLSSCSEGITVVNIDNGFGAACAAMRILRHHQDKV